MICHRNRKLLGKGLTIFNGSFRDCQGCLQISFERFKFFIGNIEHGLLVEWVSYFWLKVGGGCFVDQLLSSGCIFV